MTGKHYTQKADLLKKINLIEILIREGRGRAYFYIYISLTGDCVVLVKPQILKSFRPYNTIRGFPKKRGISITYMLGFGQAGQFPDSLNFESELLM